MSFSELNLSSALVAALPKTLKTATQIQRLAIPPALEKKDVLALAQTGSGKTLAFGLPLIDQTKQDASTIQSFVLVPTRELAHQVYTAINEIAQPIGVRLAVLVGGVDKDAQLEQLKRQPQIVVATTGRLLDLINQQAIDIRHIEQLVLDEADRLLEMGFWPDVQKLIQLLPANRQTLLFSATLPDTLNQSVNQILFNPTRLEANATNSVVDSVNETLYLVNKGSKAQALIALVKENSWKQVLVFIGAKDNADALTKKISKAGITVAALHGNKSQEEREQTLQSFKDHKVQVLVATDLLARGIHVDSLPVVINFELPSSAPVYVHRVGRTARAGQTGLAISLVCHGESDALSAIRELTQRKLALENLADFPVTDKPTSGERKRPARDKQANRRSAKKKSIKQFKSKNSR